MDTDLDDLPQVITWKGRNIENLDRADLLEAVSFLAKQSREFHSRENVRARSLGLVEMMKRGEA